MTLPQPTLLIPRRFGDARGWFTETYQVERFACHGIADVFVQDNEAFSAQVHTFRGLHFQAPPFAQAKLVRCVQGRVLDILVDIRKGSPTYGQSHQVELTGEKGEIIYVPVGYAHGYLTLTEQTRVLYKVNAPYTPTSEGGLRCFDPDLTINWPVAPDTMMANERDRNWPLLSEGGTPFIDDGAPFALRTVEL